MRRLYEINVFAQLAVTQAFLPFLLRLQQGTIANHTSVAADVAVPFNAVYNSTKSAMSLLTECLREELKPFHIRVVELKTGNVRSNVYRNMPGEKSGLTSKSLYYPARGRLNELLFGAPFAPTDIPTETWAESVASALANNSSDELWVGGNARLVYWLGTILPSGLSRMILGSMVQLNATDKAIRSYGKDKVIVEVYGQ